MTAPDDTRPLVYVETSVISYVAARASRDLVTAAHQVLTLAWWDGARRAFDLRASQLVIEEARRGDSEAAGKRLDTLRGIPLLPLTASAAGLAQRLLDLGALPRAASVDAAHVAVATVHGARFLVTWNCRHIANAARRSDIESICRAAGYEPPIICTPEELSTDDP